MSPSAANAGSTRRPVRGHLDDLAHQPAGDVQVVHGDVDEEPAGAGQEARVGRGHVPQRGAEQRDLAQLARGDPGRRGRPVGVEPAVEADLQRHARRLDGLDRRDGGRPVERERLLAEHRPPRLRRGHGELGVRAGGGRDRDRRPSARRSSSNVVAAGTPYSAATAAARSGSASYTQASSATAHRRARLPACTRPIRPVPARPIPDPPHGASSASRAPACAGGWHPRLPPSRRRRPWRCRRTPGPATRRRTRPSPPRRCRSRCAGGCGRRRRAG